MEQPNLKRVRIVRLERLRLSRNGNPRFRVHVDVGRDGIVPLTTQTDAGIGYELENPEFRDVDVDLWLSRAGHITYARPSGASR